MTKSFLAKAREFYATTSASRRRVLRRPVALRIQPAIGLLWCACVIGSAAAQEPAERIGLGEPVPDQTVMAAEKEIDATAAPEFESDGAAYGVPGAGCPVCEPGSPCDRPAESCDCFCFWGLWFCGTCDMPQHHAYRSPLQGYYYFRPYHPSQLKAQQQFVAGWGGDVRNPYSNEIFQTVYAQRSAVDVPPSILPPNAE